MQPFGLLRPSPGRFDNRIAHSKHKAGAVAQPHSCCCSCCSSLFCGSFLFGFILILFVYVLFAALEVCNNNNTTTKKTTKRTSEHDSLILSKNAVKISVSVCVCFLGGGGDVKNKGQEKMLKSWPDIFLRKQKSQKKRPENTAKQRVLLHTVFFCLFWGFALEGVFSTKRKLVAKQARGFNRGPLVWMRCATLWVFGVWSFFWGGGFLGIECKFLRKHCKNRGFAFFGGMPCVLRTDGKGRR